MGQLLWLLTRPSPLLLVDEFTSLLSQLGFLLPKEQVGEERLD